MGAMHEEIAGIIELLESHTELVIGGRTYHRGTIHGRKVVVAFSRWGKVAAASTTAAMLLKFGVTELIFTGVAGAISPQLNIGDIVIGRRFFQHDMDVRPMLRQFEIPLLGTLYFEGDAALIARAEKAATHALKPETVKMIYERQGFDNQQIRQPKIVIGDIASGDKFISDTANKKTLKERLPSVLCVEMEGAAAAQVCYEYNIPYTVIRVISDAADESAAQDFQTFINKIASRYTLSIIRELFN